MSDGTFQLLKDLLFDDLNEQQEKLRKELSAIRKEMESVQAVVRENPLLEKKMERIRESMDEERVRQVMLTQQIEKLKKESSASYVLSKVEPALDEKLVALKDSIPQAQLPDLSETIRAHIRDDRDDMIDALYPIIGNLVKKYIQVELEKLIDNINNQLDNTFSWESIKREFLSLFGIVKEKDMLLKNAIRPEVEEVYVIYQDSGLLIGHYSREETLDQDMIAGMLTAIKSFVEDAFQQQGGNLDMIEYGTFKIIIQNYRKFYIVAVVSGAVDSAFKSFLLEDMFAFGEKRLSALKESDIPEDVDSVITEMLTNHFESFNEKRK